MQPLKGRICHFSFYCQSQAYLKIFISNKTKPQCTSKGNAKSSEYVEYNILIFHTSSLILQHCQQTSNTQPDDLKCINMFHTRDALYYNLEPHNFQQQNPIIYFNQHGNTSVSNTSLKCFKQSSRGLLPCTACFTLKPQCCSTSCICSETLCTVKRKPTN